MRVRTFFANPYKDSLLRVAFDQGRKARRIGAVRERLLGCTDRTWFAVCAGYNGRGWHRSSNGELKWHGGGA